jgi:hypothetical protein
MRKVLMALALALLAGCDAQGFEYYRCTDLCRPCGIVECGQFCGQMEDRLYDPDCAASVSVAWACVDAIGCDFPLQCQAALTHVRECE